MKSTLITHKGNKDGTVTLYLGKGADRKELIDLEGLEIEISKAKTEGAIVQHPAETVLSNTIEAAEELVTVLKNAYHMIKDQSTDTEAGPGPLEIILETEGEDESPAK